MPIIIPSELEADAIQPQCLDNQFTTENVLTHMLEGRKSYLDADVIELRKADAHMEFLRSLLYSSQLVINRAFFHNSKYLDNHREEEEAALASLIEKRAIIPFLGKEASLEDSVAFTTGGADLAQRLQRRFNEDPVCLRFAREQDANTKRVDEIGYNFSSFCTSMGKFSNYDEHVRELAGALLNNSAHVDGAEASLVPKETVAAFRERLKQLANYAFNLDQTPEVDAKSGRKVEFGRNHIYAEFFIQDGHGSPTNIPAGIFKKEMREDVSLRLLKKLVDLKYNANLPDMLERYTLTPATLPGRSALPFANASQGPSTDDGLNKLVEFRRAVVDSPPEIQLPQISKLRLPDVETIRDFPEWQDFRRSQQSLLTSGFGSIVDSFDNYQKKLIGFQDKLGKWATEKHVCKRYSTGVKLVFQVGSAVLVAELLPHAASIAGHIAVETTHALLEKAIPERFDNIWVKLLITAQSAVGLDREHTYQLELMRKKGNIQRKEILDLVSEVQQSNNFMQLKGDNPAELANN